MNFNLKTTAQRGLVALGSLVAVAAAHADTGDAFTTAMTDITTKVQGYGAALVGLAAVGVVFMIGIKYVKKIRGAA